MDNPKVTAKELAEKLEAQAAQLRELTEDELFNVGGGTIDLSAETSAGTTCCGENCNDNSSSCFMGLFSACERSCIGSSPT